jgi:hypothetical protein
VQIEERWLPLPRGIVSGVRIYMKPLESAAAAGFLILAAGLSGLRSGMTWAHFIGRWCLWVEIKRKHGAFRKAGLVFAFSAHRLIFCSEPVVDSAMPSHWGGERFYGASFLEGSSPPLLPWGTVNLGSIFLCLAEENAHLQT